MLISFSLNYLSWYLNYSRMFIYICNQFLLLLDTSKQKIYSHTHTMEIGSRGEKNQSYPQQSTHIVSHSLNLDIFREKVSFLKQD